MLSYDTVSCLGVSLCVTGEDGSYLFENQAMRDRLPAICRPVAKRVLLKTGSEALASLSQGEGCFLTCRCNGQDYPFFGFRGERDCGSFFFSALTVAMPLMSIAEADRAAACLAAILGEILPRKEIAPEAAFQRIADTYFPDMLSVTAGSEVTEMVCRLLWGRDASKTR